MISIRIDHGLCDACGVFGVWAPAIVAKLTHTACTPNTAARYQQVSKISNGKRIHVYKDMGLVSQVFDEATLSSMPGDHAIGHARYSTTGASHCAQPTPRYHPARHALPGAQR